MNKRELIRKYEELLKEHSPFHEPVPYTSMVELFLKELKLLDEPEKVKVPQFVADWYEKNKTHLEYNIWEYIYKWDKQNVSQIKTWFDYSSNKPLQTLINMKQFGYEVEEEPRYTVKIKTVLGQYLGRYYLNNEELTPQFIRTQVTGKEKLPTFTQKELEEAGFGWVFDCDGVEIEEVE